VKIISLSSAHNNLSDPKDFLAFTKAADFFLKKGPKVIAYDLHPEYQSSKFAAHLSPITYRLLPIQHHHAHIASCMAENGLAKQKVIGVAFDGTGLGGDNTLWGAEFLVCDYKNFTRVAHLKTIPLLGGEKAISEPWRLAAAWLNSTYKDKFLNLKIAFIRGWDKKKWRILKDMYKAGLNSPLTSSMGRLFDAAGALILEKQNAAYEAELAITLEKLALSSNPHFLGYGFKIIKTPGQYIIDPALMFKQIVADLKRNSHKKEIAYKFHLTVAEMIRKTCLAIKKETGIKGIVLSGGVFQNNLLLELIRGLLYKEGYKVFIHKAISCNDSGVALGQVIIAGSRS
jgi:hydrogenase maturation protein HypF